MRVCRTQESRLEDKLSSRFLREKAVRIVVLLDRQSTEPNLTSVSNGIHDLDGFLAANYILSRVFGPYTVYEAR